jgi:hypothetical protein
MKKVKALALCAAAAMLLSSCTGAPPETQVPRLSFDQIKPIPLDVSRIEIIDRFHAASGPNHVELLMKQPPEQAVQDLLRKELVAAGPSKVMRIYVDAAAVTGEKLQVTNGMVGMFTQELGERYHAVIDLKFEVAELDAPDIVTHHANVHADRTKEVMKDSTLAERDMAFFHLDEELMEDVNNELQTQIKSIFGLNP